MNSTPRTVSLVSHPGARAYCGYGPTDHPILPAEAVLLATVQTTGFLRKHGDEQQTILDRFVVIPDGRDVSLLRGMPARSVLGDFEVDGDGTILFDGELPWQHDCPPTRIWFDENLEYAYRRVFGFPALVNGKYGWHVEEIDWDPAKWADHAPREGRARTAWSITNGPALLGPGGRPGVTIHDPEAAAEHLDMTVAIDQAMTWSARSAAEAIERMRANLALAESVLAGQDVPEQPSYARGSQFATDTDPIDRVVTLRRLREVFAIPPAPDTWIVHVKAAAMLRGRA